MSFIGVVSVVASTVFLAFLFSCLMTLVFASFAPHEFITEPLSHPLYTVLAYVAFYLFIFIAFSTTLWGFINFMDFMSAVEYIKL